MRRRNGSAYNSLLGSGSGTRNRPIAPGESGPCCQDNPIALPPIGTTSSNRTPLTYRPAAGSLFQAMLWCEKSGCQCDLFRRFHRTRGALIANRAINLTQSAQTTDLTRLMVPSGSWARCASSKIGISTHCHYLYNRPTAHARALSLCWNV
jgi:hypothetical protein